MYRNLITLASLIGMAYAADFVATGSGKDDGIVIDPSTIPPSDLSSVLAISDSLVDTTTLATLSPSTAVPVVMDQGTSDVHDNTVSGKDSNGGGKDTTKDTVSTSHTGKDTTNNKGSKDSGNSASSSGLACGECSADTPGGCTSWIHQPTFPDYRVFNFVCGCANRITPESQCIRFMEDAVAQVEEFAVKKCGVHLRCESQDFDPEPGSHSCEGKCPVGVGCFARCSTKCAYNVACTVISTV